MGGYRLQQQGELWLPFFLQGSLTLPIVGPFPQPTRPCGLTQVPVKPTNGGFRGVQRERVQVPEIKGNFGRIKAKRGFALLSPEARRRVAAKGGASVPAELRSFSQDRKLAVQAGRAGGAAVHNRKPPPRDED